MFLVTLDYPVELMIFFNLFFPLITFDVFPVADTYEKWFHFSEITTDHPLTDQYNIVGYGSLLVIPNLGSLWLIALIRILLPFFFWTLKRCKPFRCVPVMQRAIERLANSIIWCGTIGFFASNYLVLSVTSYIGSTDLRFGRQYNVTENFCSLLSIIGLFFSIALPVTIFVFFYKKLRYLNPDL
jgi:hypothetical protein